MKRKLYEIIKFFAIPNTLTKLIKATMNNMTYHIKIGLMMAEGFKVGNGLKQGDGFASSLFNTALQYVI
jgi:hypothetical protein